MSLNVMEAQGNDLYLLAHMAVHQPVFFIYPPAPAT